MGAHAKKSASGSKRWMNCPGSLPLVASMDPNLLRPSGAAAMLGTCAHGLGERCLIEGTDALDYLGAIIWLDQNEDAFLIDDRPDCDTPAQLSANLGKDVKFFAHVDDKMVEGVQLYLDTVRADKDEMGETCEMFVERRFDLTWLRPDMFGTSDCTLYQFLGLLRVVDYKNGYLSVDAEDNSQGMYYALGMANEVDWLFEEAEVVIVQPNSKDGKGVKRFRMTKAELETFRDLLGEASDRVDEATEALNACEDETDFREWAGTYLDAGDGDHCTFCDAFATCPAATARAESIAIADFSDDPPSENEVHVTDEESLERLSQLLKWGDYLDKLIKAAKTLGQRRLEQGLEVPGYKLVTGKANRIYAKTDEEIIAALKADAGVDPTDCYEEPKPPKLKSPAQLEKLGKKVKARIAGVYDEDKETWVKEPLAIKPVGKLTIAPLSDKREAVIPGTAADDFVDDVETEYGE